MANKYSLLIAALSGAAILADLAAHRDEVVSRRVRELNPETVQSELDRIRNRRWHNLGFAQRAVVVALLSAVLVLAWHVQGWLVKPWLAFGLTVWLTVWTTALVFDTAFNIRMKLPWHYFGTTSVLDQKKTASGGKVAAARTAGLILLGLLAWALFKF